MKEHLRLLASFSVLVLALSSCGGDETETGSENASQPKAESVVRWGDYVTVSYTGSLVDGKVFDSTSTPGRTPLSFQLGKSPLFKKVEEAIVGMKPGETRKIELKPSEAYGEKYQPFEYSKAVFGKDLAKSKEGDTVAVAGMSVKILKIRSDAVEVAVPSPEPLAGESLKYEVRLESVRSK